MAMSLISVVIADDHRLFREGLRLIIEQEESIEVAGEAVNGTQAISVISDLKPDVVLLDIKMPEKSGIEILPAIRKNSPKTKPLMLSGIVDEKTILMALKLGAKGYISKDAGVSDLIKAIEIVHRGELWVEHKLISKFFTEEESIVSSAIEDQPKKVKGELSQRELEVLRCLTTGCTNKELAQALFISEKTVKSHLNSIFKKLNITGRLQAILYAIHNGLA
jgi:DNA-binding NarL/FixJ family response regulator